MYTRKLFRLAACVLCCLVAMRTAFAQQDKWDSRNALDVAEGHEYFRRWWLGHDAGGDFSLLNEFTFTHHPDSTWALLGPALGLFEKLYADRLSLNDVFNYYGVLELVDDDPAVLAQFRQYTTSGELTTDTVVDSEAYQKHLLALLDAMTTQEHFTLGGGVDAAGTSLTSQMLQAKQESAAMDVSADAPNEPSPFKDMLQCLIRQSLLKCMSDKGLYKDGKFDCQDFAFALLAYLHRRFGQLGNVYGDLVWKDLGIHWQCPITDAQGNVIGYKKHTHAIGLVRVPAVPASPGPPPTPELPAKDYIFDPQTGTMLDVSECAGDARCIAKKAIQMFGTNYDTCSGSEFGLVEPAHVRSPIDTELEGYIPWWKCKDALPDDANCPNDPEVNPWVRFKKYLAECCNATTPACGTLTAPATCNPDWYIWN